MPRLFDFADLEDRREGLQMLAQLLDHALSDSGPGQQEYGWLLIISPFGDSSDNPNGAGHVSNIDQRSEVALAMALLESRGVKHNA